MDLKYILLLFGILFGTEISQIQAAKILGLFTTIGKSHTILGQALLKSLADHGHEVTMVTLFPSKPHKNYRELVLKTDILKIMFKGETEMNAFNASNNGLSFIFEFSNLNAVATDAILSDEVVQNLMKSSESFDIVILPAFFNEALYGLANHFNAHLVVFSLIGPSVLSNDLVGLIAPYAYVPGMMFSNPMSLTERLLNTLVGVAFDLFRNLYHLKKMDAIRAKHFPNTTNIYDVMQQTSLIFLSSHSSITPIQPLLPNMIEIGGFQVQKPALLPKDIQTYLDSSPEGVVYFSLGSNAKSKHMPTEIKNAIFDVLGKLPEKVLLKWEEDVLPGQPKNVKISKWFPQSDILAHPNIKLFITHGGWGGLNEAIVRRVPIVGIPVMAEQNKNLDEAQKLGYGVKLDLNNITRESLSWALNEILRNPKYKKKIDEVGSLFLDREMAPMEKANFWIEYVIRTNGAKHLRCSSLDLKWYQNLLIDVIAVISGVLLIVLTLIYLLLKALVRFYKRKFYRDKVKTSKKNN